MKPRLTRSFFAVAILVACAGTPLVGSAQGLGSRSRSIRSWPAQPKKGPEAAMARPDRPPPRPAPVPPRDRFRAPFSDPKRAPAGGR